MEDTQGLISRIMMEAAHFIDIFLTDPMDPGFSQLNL